ncbi:MAG: response regulator transcription factor [Anaerolineales bacterium]|jgi:two-component system response regulator DesR
MTVKVLIVDDVEQVRYDLRTLLSLSGDIEIVGEAANGLEAIKEVATLQPDVVILDLEMPTMDGYQTARHIKARDSSCRVIVLSVHAYPEAQQNALRAGADHFIVKGTPIDSLIQTILGKKN